MRKCSFWLFKLHFISFNMMIFSSEMVNLDCQLDWIKRWLGD
jgi:hypothetical protein